MSVADGRLHGPTGVVAAHADLFDTAYVEHTRVSSRSVGDWHPLPSAAISIERFVSEALAAGDGSQEFLAWCERQADKRGLG